MTALGVNPTHTPHPTHPRTNTDDHTTIPLGPPTLLVGSGEFDSEHGVVWKVVFDSEHGFVWKMVSLTVSMALCGKW